MKNRLIVALLTLLGFGGAACTAGCEQRVEYGVPHADYTIKGKVTDAQGVGIPGIEIASDENTQPGNLYPVGSTETGGIFSLHFPYGWPDNEITLLFRDIDGPDNRGSFEQKQVEVTFTEADRVEKGSGGWYDGAFEIDDMEVVLDDDHGVAATNELAKDF